MLICLPIVQCRVVLAANQLFLSNILLFTYIQLQADSCPFKKKESERNVVTSPDFANLNADSRGTWSWNSDDLG
jgi:hypothetical protein